VSLSVFQSIPLDGIIIVASPQDLVGMVVEKAVKMAEMMNVPIVGLVENMSYVACPDCGKKIYLFGEGKTAQAAAAHNLPLLAEMPIDPALASLTDAGSIEDFQGDWLKTVAAFHGFLSVYGTHFHKVTNFPAIVFVGKNSCKSSRNPG